MTYAYRIRYNRAYGENTFLRKGYLVWLVWGENGNFLDVYSDQGVGGCTSIENMLLTLGINLEDLPTDGEKIVFGTNPPPEQNQLL